MVANARPPIDIYPIRTVEQDSGCDHTLVSPSAALPGMQSLSPGTGYEHRLRSASEPVHVRADLPSLFQLLQGEGRVWHNSFSILLQTLQSTRDNRWGLPGRVTSIFSSQHRLLEDVEVLLLGQFLLRVRIRPDPLRDHPKQSRVDVRIDNPLEDRFCLRLLVGGESLAWRGNR